MVGEEVTVRSDTWRSDCGEKRGDWRMEAWRTRTVGYNVWRLDSGEKREDQRMEACLDSLDFPLPFSGGHVASGRSAWDSPSLLSVEQLDFLRQPPPLIHLVPNLDWMAENHVCSTPRSESLMKKKVREKKVGCSISPVGEAAGPVGAVG